MILIDLFYNNIFNIEELQINFLKVKLTDDQINKYLDFQKKWEWVSYSLLILFLIIKTTIIASVLYIGTFFYSKAKVTFKQLFNTVVKAEFVFLSVGVLKIVWFYFFFFFFTLVDLQYFFSFKPIIH